jgi:nicotinic acid phosphoribosyltransferase
MLPARIVLMQQESITGQSSLTGLCNRLGLNTSTQIFVEPLTHFQVWDFGYRRRQFITNRTSIAPAKQQGPWLEAGHSQAREAQET